MLLVEVQHSDVSRFGEASPSERYNETAESARAYIEDRDAILGDDAFALDETLACLPPREFAARAAIDAALHDLGGKLTGYPVWRSLGQRRSGPSTTWTLRPSDPDLMASRARAASRRFLPLKLKLGGHDGSDADRMRAVRALTDLPLQVDANKAWSFDEALESLDELASLSGAVANSSFPPAINVDPR